MTRSLNDSRLAERVDAWKTGYAPVLWHAKAKSDGSVRPICTLPPDLKAVHYMLAEVIGQQFHRGPGVYGVRGFGRDDAARALKALQNAGYRHLAKTDIVDCYQSIDNDALFQLPLPREVISTALDTTNLTFTERRNARDLGNLLPYPIRGHISTHKASGPKGLIQGSPASGIILAWLLNSLPTSDDAKVVLCFDTFVLAARSRSGSREMVSTLAAHLERCPAGPLALCEAEYADDTPIEFLGDEFDPARQDIGIAHSALDRLEARLVRAEKEDEEEFHHLQDNPLIYIRAVAVREDHQGRGLGTALVVDAMKRCLGIARQMGAAAIVLDVLDDGQLDRRWKFYHDLGFRPLGDPDNPHRVFIPMADLRATLG